MTDHPIIFSAPMDDAIRAALRAAARVACFGGTSGDQCDRRVRPVVCTAAHAYMRSTGAAIAAFLRALPDRFPMPGKHNPDCNVWGHASGEMARLAAAVDRVAREGNDGR